MIQPRLEEILGIAYGTPDAVYEAVRRARSEQLRAQRLDAEIEELKLKVLTLEADNTSLRARLFACRVARDSAKAKYEDAQAALIRQRTCWKCQCLLIVDEDPPHCEDCLPYDPSEVDEDAQSSE